LINQKASPIPLKRKIYLNLSKIFIKFVEFKQLKITTMALDNEFFDNVVKFEKFRPNPDLNDFFETFDRLVKLAEEQDNKIIDSVKQKKQAQDLTKKLKDKKDEIARRTKTQKEFEAVYFCIDYLDNYFNHLK
jgi:hypothetical protein